jgi:hypothetical protein
MVQLFFHSMSHEEASLSALLGCPALTYVPNNSSRGSRHQSTHPVVTPSASDTSTLDSDVSPTFPTRAGIRSGVERIDTMNSSMGSVGAFRGDVGEYGSGGLMTADSGLHVPVAITDEIDPSLGAYL